MNLEELRAIGAQMSNDELQASLHALTQDRRFAAVVEIIRREKELASDSSSQLKFASEHGCLAHAAGVRYAHLELENKLRAACVPRKARKIKNPPPDPEE